MCGGTIEKETSPLQSSPKNVAIIGSGIDALLIAWALDKINGCSVSIFPEEHDSFRPSAENDGHDICLYEHHSSKLFSAVLEELHIDNMKSISKETFQKYSFEMNGSDYSNMSHTPSTPFANDILKFKVALVNILNFSPEDPRRHVKIGEFVKSHGYSQEFVTGFLTPLLGDDESALFQFTVDQVLVNLYTEGLLDDLVVSDKNQDHEEKYLIIDNHVLESKLVDLLSSKIQNNSPIVSIEKVTSDDVKHTSYELIAKSNTSAGFFDDILFATSSIDNISSLLKKTQIDPSISAALAKEKEGSQTVEVFFHNDRSVIKSKNDHVIHWNSISHKADGTKDTNNDDQKKREAMEGGESGFGNKIMKEKEQDMKSSVTYNFESILERELFISINPIKDPHSSLIKKKRSFVLHSPEQSPIIQGKENLWFYFVKASLENNGIIFPYEKKCDKVSRLAKRVLNVSMDLSTTPKKDGKFLSLAPTSNPTLFSSLWKSLTYTLPIKICKQMIFSFLDAAIQKGILQIKMNDGYVVSFGNVATEDGVDKEPVVIRVFDEWFFVKTALEYDLGMARSYMAGYFTVEALENPKDYDQTLLWPSSTAFETNSVIGDPIGLTRLFLLFINNRDSSAMTSVTSSAKAHRVANSLSNASGLFLAKLGSFINYLRYKITMDNSEKGGSLKNIHAHYDLSNDLFRTFLDNETLMYSSAIYNGITNPNTNELTFKGTLEEAQWRKLDTLLARAQMTHENLHVLDIGFGWGGLSLHAARKYNAQVHGITLSVEQMALAQERVKKEKLEHLITFEVIDYRTFAKKKENFKKFDRVLSCEMIEAVGHEHLGEFYESVEKVLKRDGVLVMEAITTPEERYEVYRRSTDLINTIIFPGSCCPSLHALIDAAYKNSTLSLEHISNIGQHYARTLAEWRRRFNKNEDFIRRIGFDSVFMRVWNYYLTYCEAAFYSRTENCLILVFARPGCNALAALNETREICQAAPLSAEEAELWLQD